MLFVCQFVVSFVGCARGLMRYIERKKHKLCTGMFYCSLAFRDSSCKASYVTVDVKQSQPFLSATQQSILGRMHHYHMIS